MARWRACVKAEFSAAHEVRGHPYGGLHGHDFELTVCVCRDALDERGFVIDYYELRERVREAVSALDHSVLNRVLGTERATLEAVADWLYRRLGKAVKGVCLVRVCGPREFCIELATD